MKLSGFIELFKKDKNKSEAINPRGKSTYGGLIRFYGIEEFWDNLSAREREIIKGIHGKDIDDVDKYIKSDHTKMELLNDMSIRCSIINEDELSHKIILEMIKQSDNPIDLHNAYSILVYIYNQHIKDGEIEYIEKCIEVCKKDINLYPEYKKAYFDKPNIDKKHLQRHINSFKVLANIYEQLGNYNEAIKICKLALNFQIPGGYGKKLNDLKRKHLENSIVKTNNSESDIKSKGNISIVRNNIGGTNKEQAMFEILESLRYFVEIESLKQTNFENSSTTLKDSMLAINPHMNFIGTNFFAWLDKYPNGPAFKKWIDIMESLTKNKENFFNVYKSFFFSNIEFNIFVEKFFDDLNEAVQFKLYSVPFKNIEKNIRFYFPRYPQISGTALNYFKWLVSNNTSRTFTFYIDRLSEEGRNFGDKNKKFIFEDRDINEFKRVFFPDAAEATNFINTYGYNSSDMKETLEAPQVFEAEAAFTVQDYKKVKADNKTSEINLGTKLSGKFSQLNQVAKSFCLWLDENPRSKAAERIGVKLQEKESSFISNIKPFFTEEVRLVNFIDLFIEDLRERNSFRLKFSGKQDPKTIVAVTEFVNHYKNMSFLAVCYAEWIDSHPKSEANKYFHNSILLGKEEFFKKNQSLFTGNKSYEQLLKSSFSNKNEARSFEMIYDTKLKKLKLGKLL